MERARDRRGVASPSRARPLPLPQVSEATSADVKEAAKSDLEQQDLEHEARRRAAMRATVKRLEAEAFQMAAEKPEQKPEDAHEARRRAALRPWRERLEAEARRGCAEEAERRHLRVQARQRAAEEAERLRLEEDARQAAALLENLVSRFPHKSREDVARDLQKGEHAGTLAQMYRREASQIGVQVFACDGLLVVSGLRGV